MYLKDTTEFLNKLNQIINLINSNLNNTRTLFATVERLTNPPSQIPSEMLSDSKCNEFASFFSEKISNIYINKVLYK